MYSVWLVLGLVLLQGFIARWLMLGYQRLALQAAIEKRDAARAAREAAEVEDQKVSAEEAELAVEEPEVDLAVLDSERRRLLRTIIGLVAIVSLWAIWAPIIPAIGILQDISLWTATRTVGGEAVHVPVTMADVLIAVLVAVMTGAAARGLPAFIEYILLQRTQISAGSRYTATTLLRYTIIGVGTIIVVGILGARWAQIQWLVAALGVGIGFGLQEIVANFISGLIILFERPIRIGDVVSVGNTSGVVTRINIRATTIRDWDRRELLVPNREFITGQLLNWSLSDSILRIVVPVGIRYGSDVGLAMKIAEEVALDNDDVLDDPESFVVFESFGDNAINLTLRAYVQSISVLMRVKTELHSELNNRLTEAGIVIAYPQRDVHLDTSRPLEICLRQDTTPLADGAV
jgi:potassium efflux system protein